MRDGLPNDTGAVADEVEPREAGQRAVESIGGQSRVVHDFRLELTATQHRLFAIRNLCGGCLNIPVGDGAADGGRDWGVRAFDGAAEGFVELEVVDLVGFTEVHLSRAVGALGRSDRSRPEVDS